MLETLAGSIVDGLVDETSNITAGNISLISAGTVGTSSDDIELTSTGSLTVNSSGEVNLMALVNDLQVGQINAVGQKVTMATSVGSIVDALGDETANITAADVTINSTGAVGTVGEDLNLTSSGVVNITSNGLVNIESIGNISLGTIESNDNAITVLSSGDILDGLAAEEDTDENIDALAYITLISTGGNIGSVGEDVDLRAYDITLSAPGLIHVHEPRGSLTLDKAVGSSLILKARDAVQVNTGGVVSSRVIADILNGDHTVDASTADSGDIHIYGERFRVYDGGKMLSYADNGFTSGAIMSETDIYTIDTTNAATTVNAGDTIIFSRATDGDITLNDAGMLSTDEMYNLDAANVYIGNHANTNSLTNNVTLSTNTYDFTANSTVNSLHLSGKVDVSITSGGSILLPGDFSLTSNSTTGQARAILNAPIDVGGNVNLSAISSVGRAWSELQGVSGAVNIGQNLTIYTEANASGTGSEVAAGISLGTTPLVVEGDVHLEAHNTGTDLAQAYIWDSDDVTIYGDFTANAYGTDGQTESFILDSSNLFIAGKGTFFVETSGSGNPRTYLGNGGPISILGGVEMTNNATGTGSEYATIYSTTLNVGGLSRTLLVNADGSVDPTSNIGLSKSGNDIILKDVSTANVSLNSNNIWGNPTINLNDGDESVSITNNSSKNLIVQDVLRSVDGSLLINGTPQASYGSFVVNTNTSYGTVGIDIANNSSSDVTLTGNISNSAGGVNITNTGGSIFGDGTELITASTVDLSAVNGSIGTVPEAIDLNTTSTVTAQAGGVVNLTETVSDLTLDDVIGGSVILTNSAGDIILNSGKTISSRIIADMVAGNHAVDSSTADSGDITLSGTTLTLNSGSNIVSFADSGFNDGDIRLLFDDYAINTTDAFINAGTNTYIARNTAGNITLGNAGLLTPAELYRINSTNLIVGNDATTNSLANNVTLADTFDFDTNASITNLSLVAGNASSLNGATLTLPGSITLSTNAASGVATSLIDSSIIQAGDVTLTAVSADNSAYADIVNSTLTNVNTVVLDSTAGGNGIFSSEIDGGTGNILGTLTMSGASQSDSSSRTEIVGGANYTVQGDVTMTASNNGVGHVYAVIDGATLASSGNVSLNSTNTANDDAYAYINGGSIDADGNVSLIARSGGYSEASVKYGGSISSDKDITVDSGGGGWGSTWIHLGTLTVNNDLKTLLIDADGSINPSSTMSAVVGGGNIDVSPISYGNIILNGSNVWGDGTINLAGGYSSIDITNNSANILTVNDLNTLGEGVLNVNGTPTTSHGTFVINNSGSGTPQDITVTNNANSDIILAGNIFSPGGNISVTNNGSANDISLAANKTLSTRTIADIASGNHSSDASTADSGDITLAGTTLTLNSGSNLLTFADSGFNDGDIRLLFDNYTINTTDATINAGTNTYIARNTVGDISLNNTTGLLTPAELYRINSTNLIIGNDATTTLLTNGVYLVDDFDFGANSSITNLTLASNNMSSIDASTFTLPGTLTLLTNAGVNNAENFISNSTLNITGDVVLTSTNTGAGFAASQINNSTINTVNDIIINTTAANNVAGAQLYYTDVLSGRNISMTANENAATANWVAIDWANDISLTGDITLTSNNTGAGESTVHINDSTINSANNISLTATNTVGRADTTFYQSNITNSGNITLTSDADNNRAMAQIMRSTVDVGGNILLDADSNTSSGNWTAIHSSSNISAGGNITLLNTEAGTAETWTAIDNSIVSSEGNITLDSHHSGSRIARAILGSATVSAKGDILLYSHADTDAGPKSYIVSGSDVTVGGSLTMTAEAVGDTWSESYITDSTVTLGNANQILLVNADNTIDPTSTIGATISGGNINVAAVNDDVQNSVSLNAVNVSGNGVINLFSGNSSVDITNNSSNNLILDTIHTTGGADFKVNNVAQASYDAFTINTTTDNTAKNVTITTNTDSDILLGGNIFAPGGNIVVTNNGSNNSVTVGAASILSTRNIADIKTGNHNTDASTADSGDITLNGSTIAMNAGSKLLSFADSGYVDGDIALIADDWTIDTADANTSINGGNVIFSRDTAGSIYLNDAGALLAGELYQVTADDLIIGNHASTNALTDQIHLWNGYDFVTNPGVSKLSLIGTTEVTLNAATLSVPELLLKANSTVGNASANIFNSSLSNIDTITFDVDSTAGTSDAVIDGTWVYVADSITMNSDGTGLTRSYINNTDFSTGGALTINATSSADDAQAYLTASNASSASVGTNATLISSSSDSANDATDGAAYIEHNGSVQVDGNLLIRANNGGSDDDYAYILNSDDVMVAGNVNIENNRTAGSDVSGAEIDNSDITIGGNLTISSVNNSGGSADARIEDASNLNVTGDILLTTTSPWGYNETSIVGSVITNSNSVTLTSTATNNKAQSQIDGSTVTSAGNISVSADSAHTTGDNWVAIDNNSVLNTSGDIIITNTNSAAGNIQTYLTSTVNGANAVSMTSNNADGSSTLTITGSDLNNVNNVTISSTSTNGNASANIINSTIDVYDDITMTASETGVGSSSIDLSTSTINVGMNGTTGGRILLVNADGSIDSSSNIGATIGGGDVLVDDISSTGDLITLSAGSLTGNATVNLLGGSSSIDITNNSVNTLSLNNLYAQTAGNFVYNSTSYDSYGSLTINKTSEGTAQDITITNNPSTDININGTISNTNGNIVITNPTGGNLVSDGTSLVTTTGNLTVSAAGGAIGNSTNALEFVAAGMTTASSTGDIYLTATSGDINVNNLTSSAGDIYLTTATGSILDGLGAETSNISAADILLTSAGTIGTLAEDLDVAMSGEMTANAPGVITINDLSGDFSVNHVESTSDDVYLSASSGGIDDGSGNALEIVIGNNLTFTAFTFVGNSSDDFEIDSNGLVTVTAGGEVNLEEMGTGDLVLNQINAPGRTVKVTSSLGILDGSGTEDPNIIGALVDLKANLGSIGTALEDFDIAASGNVEADATADINLTDSDGDFKAYGIVSTGGNVILTSAAGGIIDAAVGSASHVSGNTITLNASFGFVGTLADNLDIGATGIVNVLAGGEVNINEYNGDLVLGQVNAAGQNVIIGVVDGSILDGSGDESANIIADTLTMEAKAATRTIGTLLDDVDIDVSGVVNVASNDIINIEELSGSMLLGLIKSNSGEDVYLKADNSILDGLGDESENLFGANITLISTNGSIGTAVDDIDAYMSFNGKLTATAAGDINFTDIFDDFYINSITSSAGDIYLTSGAGTITDATVGETALIVGKNIILTSSAGIGNILEDIDIDSTGNISILAVTDVNIQELSGNMALNNVSGATVLLTNSSNTGNDDIIINSGMAVSASSAGNSLVLNTVNGSFINNAGASALSASSGRWLVYSDNPTNTYENGLTYNKIYNKTYATDAPATIPAGNHILYSISPSLTIQADDKIRLYGDNNPSFTYTLVSGLIDGDTEGAALSGNPSLTTTATNASPVNTYVISSAQGGLTSPLGYTLNFTDGTLTVTPAALTITADDKAKIYGDSNPALTATYAGFKLTDDATDLTGTLDLATAATDSSNVGHYAITPSGVTSGNYTITFTDGDLEITPAALTITADDKAKIYGDSNPALTATYAGFKLTDDATDLTGTLDLATAATDASNVGHYAITPSGVTSGNYTITFNNGDLEITPAALTITADDKAKLSGNTNPIFTATYDGFKLDDTPESLDGLLRFMTDVTKNATPGTFNITPFGQSSENYIITYVPGVIAVNSQPINDEVQKDVANVTQDIVISNSSDISTTIPMSDPAPVTAILDQAPVETSTSTSIIVNTTPKTSTTSVVTTSPTTKQSTSVPSKNSSPSTPKENATSADTSDNTVSNSSATTSKGEVSSGSSSNQTTSDTSTNTSTSSSTTTVTNNNSSETSQGDEGNTVSGSELNGLIVNISANRDSIKKDVTYQSNLKLLNQMLTKNEPELEFEADEIATKAMNKLDYHPAALKAYLKVVLIIEKVKSANGESVPASQIARYLHPGTQSRIDKIDSILSNMDVKAFDGSKTYKNLYQQALSQAPEDFELTPKVNKVIQYIHKVNDALEYGQLNRRVLSVNK